jgi:hypothetical protein
MLLKELTSNEGVFVPWRGAPLRTEAAARDL